MIQVQRLEGFYRVGKAGGYTRAAKTFSYPITQPGVHQQVRRLEEDIGVRLFERVARDRVVLTPEGRRLFTLCEPFFEALPDVVRSLREGNFAATIRIQAAALELRYLMPEWIRRLRAANRSAKVELREIDAPDFGDLLSGACDVIVDFVSDVPAALASREVGTHHAFLVAPADWSLGRSNRTVFGRIADRPFVSFHSGLPHFAIQMQALSRIGIRTEPTLGASSTESILALVAAGLGYSLIPWPTTKGPTFSGAQALALKGPGTSFPIQAIWRRSQHPNELLRALLDAAP